ncbi:MAG: hypothetical protein AB1765_13325 [Candidatus Hydrogenedentota bacterium]
MANPEIHTNAVVYYLMDRKLWEGYIEFFSAFIDGLIIITYNSRLSSSFIYPDHMIMRRVTTNNVEELLQIHLEQVEKFKNEHQFRNMEDYDYIYESKKNVKEVLSYQEQNGLMKSCEACSVYKLTLIGAIKMVFMEWISFRYLRDIFKRKPVNYS